MTESSWQHRYWGPCEPAESRPGGGEANAWFNITTGEQKGLGSRLTPSLAELSDQSQSQTWSNTSWTVSLPVTLSGPPNTWSEWERVERCKECFFLCQLNNDRKVRLTEGGERGPMPSHVPPARGCNVCLCDAANRDVRSIPRGLFDSSSAERWKKIWYKYFPFICYIQHNKGSKATTIYFIIFKKPNFEKSKNLQ